MNFYLIMCILTLISLIAVREVSRPDKIKIEKELLGKGIMRSTLGVDILGNFFHKITVKYGDHEVKSRVDINYDDWKRAYSTYLYMYKTEEAVRNAYESSEKYNRKSSNTSSYNPNIDAAFTYLGILRTKNVGAIKSAFRKRAKECHPDVGGDAESFSKLTKCQEVALRYAG